MGAGQALESSPPAVRGGAVAARTGGRGGGHALGGEGGGEGCGGGQGAEHAICAATIGMVWCRGLGRRGVLRSGNGGVVSSNTRIMCKLDFFFPRI